MLNCMSCFYILDINPLFGHFISFALGDRYKKNIATIYVKVVLPVLSSRVSAFQSLFGITVYISMFIPSLFIVVIDAL